MVKKEVAWWAFRYNANSKNIEMFNVFNSINFLRYLFYDIKSIKSKADLSADEKKDLTEKIKGDLRGAYWGKFEYESSVGNPFCEDCHDFKKIDIWWQLEPNIDIFVDYILDNLKAVKKICKVEHYIGVKTKKKKKCNPNA